MNSIFSDAVDKREITFIDKSDRTKSNDRDKNIAD